MKNITRSVVLLVTVASSANLLANQSTEAVDNQLMLSEANSEHILIPGLLGLAKNLVGQLLSKGIAPKKAQEIADAFAEEGKKAIEEQGGVAAPGTPVANSLSLSESNSEHILIPGLLGLAKGLVGQLLSKGIAPKKAQEIADAVTEEGKKAIAEQGGVPAPGTVDADTAK